MKINLVMFEREMFSIERLILFPQKSVAKLWHRTEGS